MASDPITSWQIDVENVKRVSDFIFLGSKINADGDCNHKIKRSLLLGRIAMTNSVLKSRDSTWLSKVHIVKAMVFSAVMYGCESWTIKKAVKRKSLSCFQFFATKWTVVCQASLSMESSRKEYRSGLPFPSQRFFPIQGLNPSFLHCRLILYHLSTQGISH